MRNEYNEIARTRWERPHELDLKLQHGGQIIMMITDSEMIANVGTRRAKLIEPCTAPAWKCIINKWSEWTSIYGIRPRTDGSDMILLRPREHNKTADALCNVSLDDGLHTEWYNEHATTILASRPHIILHGDGGCRKKRQLLLRRCS